MATLQTSEWQLDEIQSGIDEIRKDRASGARKLALRAAMLLIRCARDAEEDVPELARALMAAQPAMAPVFNLAWRALASSDVAGACTEFLESMERNTARVAELAADLVDDGVRAMTHSFSSTVLAAFREASRQGKRFSVICPESRPICEGVAMAASLGMAGIDSSVIADSAVYRFLPEARLALVGADAVSPRSVFNKTGTALLALAAGTFGVRVYALCPSDRFLPRPYEPPPEEPKNPRELLERELPHVSAVNYYFDATPIEYVSGFVTEDGILTPAEMRDRLLGREMPCQRPAANGLPALTAGSAGGAVALC
jgi:translation initiation factor 2B subunit (eIF-2B alpha/beta/delta family)